MDSEEVAGDSRSLYEILDVPQSADDEAIRRNYFKLSLKFHPDKASNERAVVVNFHKISLAYETLKDRDKRNQYDLKLQEQTRWQSRSELVPLEEIFIDNCRACSYCRCGSLISIAMEDFAEGITIVQCSGCSLYLNLRIAAGNLYSVLQNSTAS